MSSLLERGDRSDDVLDALAGAGGAGVESEEESDEEPVARPAAMGFAGVRLRIAHLHLAPPPLAATPHHNPSHSHQLSMGDSDSEEEEEEEEQEDGESDESPIDVAQAPEVPEATEAKPKSKPVVDLNDPERVALVTLIQAFAEDDHERTELKLSPSLSPRERAMAHEVTKHPHLPTRNHVILH